MADSAGISPPAPVDVRELVARLKDEVRKGPKVYDGDGAGLASARAAARSQAERFWPVSAERPLERRSGLRGAVLQPVKRALRKLMRFYVEPLALEQRSFNDATLKLVDAISEQVDELVAARTADGRLIRELEERLLRLERRGEGQALPATVASQPGAAALPDYFAFESRMRAPTEEISRRQRSYVEDFRDAAPVLDVGCGRGEFLGLLRDAGVDARGVDADADMVAYAQGEGLEVVQEDALAHLEGQEDGSLGGIFAAQLVEHLPPAALQRLLELAARKLRAGGLFVAETINPLSPLALRHYFADLTHAQPLVPETLELLARQAGFRETELRFLNAPEPAPETHERVNEVLFAPLDYALIART
jgi:O-antigen chain-terminating methyltransferase